MHKGEGQDIVEKISTRGNYKCSVQVVYDGVKRERINGWVEESGMLGYIQGGFRMGRRTEDNLFMLERIIEMVKARKERLFVAFNDMEKAYDRVNRNKLFEVMRGYGVQEILVDVIERIYDGSMVKFELESNMIA